MKIHAIQTGTVAIKRNQRHGQGHGIFRTVNTLLDHSWTEPLPILAWVIEHPEGLIVVDTGETSRSSEPGYFPSWHPYFKVGVRTFVEAGDEIGPQLNKLGFSIKDVQWLVLTHLHTDHAGGLHFFPNTEILVSAKEYLMASGLHGRLRGYLPNRWPDWFKPTLIDFTGSEYGSFPTSHGLTQAGDVLLVPTPGHTHGHLSVIVQDGPLSYFIAGDTSYTEELMIKQVIDGVAPDESAARMTLSRIRNYIHETPTIYLPSHDSESQQRLQNKVAVSISRINPLS